MSLFDEHYEIASKGEATQLREQLADEREKIVKYPFPLRENVCCFFEVPRNLTKSEVERIRNYLLSLST
jgi:hypothetical protein